MISLLTYICFITLAFLVFVAIKFSGVLSNLSALSRVSSFSKISGIGSEQAMLWDLYIKLFNSALNPIIAIDKNNNIIAWNARAEKNFGWTQQEVFKKELTNFIIPNEFREEYLGWVNSYRINNITTEREFSVIKKNSKTLSPARFYLSKLIKADEIGEIGIIIVDITSEKEKEKEFKNEILFLEQGESDSGLGTWEWDLLDKKLNVSKNFCKIFNIDEKKSMSIDLMFELVYPPDRIKAVKQLNDAVKNKRNYETLYRRLQADGTLRWLHVISNFKMDAYGEISKIHGTIQFEKKTERKEKKVVRKIKTDLKEEQK